MLCSKEAACQIPNFLSIDIKSLRALMPFGWLNDQVGLCSGSNHCSICYTAVSLSARGHRISNGKLEIFQKNDNIRLHSQQTDVPKFDEAFVVIMN